MKHAQLAIASLTLLAAAACSPGVDLAAERALLEQADRRYTETANAGDVDGLAGLYAADATRYPPTGAPVSGPAAMRAFAEAIATMPGFHLEATPLRLEVSSDGDMGFTLNLLEMTVTGPDGEPTVQHLRDFHTWRKEADGWKIVDDIWHVMTETEPGG